MVKKSIILIHLLFCFGSCTIAKVEKKPNSSLQEILNSHFIYTEPFSIYGSFDNLKDKSYYPIQITKAGVYSISISSIKGLNTKISVIDSSLRPLIVADDYYANFGEYIPNFFFKTGIYFILVEISQTDFSELSNINNQYLLAIKPLEMKLPNHEKYIIQQKPNSSFTTIQKIELNTPLIGYYSPVLNNLGVNKSIELMINYISHEANKNLSPYNIALYTFRIPEKGKFVINASITGVPDFDPVLSIFDIPFLQSLIHQDKKKQGLAIVKDDLGFNKGENISNLLINGQASYIVAVLASARLNYKTLEEALNNFYNLQITYSKTPLNVIVGTKQNNSFEKAKIVTHSSIIGALDSQYDKNYFVIKNFHSLIKESQKNSGQKIDIKKVVYGVITLNQKNNFPIALDIYNAHKEILKSIPSSITNPHQIIVPNFYFNLARPYYLVIRALRTDIPKASNSTSYQINIQLQNRSTDPMIELEPDDNLIASPESPPFLNLMTHTLWGYINSPGDTDYLLFRAPMNGLYTISLDKIPHAFFIMKIFNQNNTLIKIKTSHGKGKGFSIQQKMKKNDLIKISIKTEELDFFDFMNPYIITITK